MSSVRRFSSLTSAISRAASLFEYFTTALTTTFEIVLDLLTDNWELLFKLFEGFIRRLRLAAFVA